MGGFLDGWQAASLYSHPPMPRLNVAHWALVTARGRSCQYFDVRERVEELAKFRRSSTLLHAPSSPLSGSGPRRRSPLRLRLARCPRSSLASAATIMTALPPIPVVAC